MVSLGKTSDDFCLRCGATHDEGAPHRRKDADPIDLSWVTTEPVYEGPAWMHWVKLIASIAFMGMLCAIAIAVLVK